MSQKTKNKNQNLIKFSIASLVLLLLILSSFGFYTNIFRYYEDSRRSDGASGFAFERTSNEFIVDGCGSGTVLDTVTALCWQKDLSSAGVATKAWATSTAYAQPTWDNSTKTYSYPSAAKANYPVFAYCEDLSLGGNTDWRVPSISEYYTLVDEIGGNGATCTRLGTIGFTNCQNAYYFSDKEYKVTTTNAWHLNLNNGLENNIAKTTSETVVCIRS